MMQPSDDLRLSARTTGLFALALAALSAAILPLLRPVLPVDETRYLSVAWEMHRDHSYIVPHLNGAIYAHKPPLLFWLINLIWSITGVSEVAARLVAPVFGVLTVALTWVLGTRFYPDRPERGATAALILASTGVFALYGSLTMFDTMLASATLLGILALLRMDAGSRWPAVIGLGAALAFGVLAKGPVILVHLMPLVLSRPLWTQAAAPGKASAWYGRVALAISVALAMLAIWLVPALWLGGADYRAEVLWRQSAGRMVNAFDHARPVWFFVAALPILLWPWAWRPAVLREVAVRGLWQDRRARFLGIWGGGTLLLFSLISGKQLHYLLPALPAAALALSAAPVPRRGWGPVIAALLFVAPVLIWASMLSTGRSRIDGVVVETLGVTTLALATAIAVVGLAIIWIATRRAPVIGWALITPVVLLVTHIALRPALFEHYDTARFAEELGRQPSAGVAIDGYPYQGEFGFTACLQAPIQVLDDAEREAWIAAHPGGLLISARDDPPVAAAPVGTGWLAGRKLQLYRIP